MRFKDRKDAALQLVPYLKKYTSDQGVLLAIPRGGVPIAFHISKQTGLPVELLMSKKIGHPSNPEYAIGAVSLEDHIIDKNSDVSDSYVQQEVERIRENLTRRRKLFAGGEKPTDLTNRTIIIVDDGIATGKTILSTISMLRKKGPKKIVVAVPVAPIEAAQLISRVVDEFICINQPDNFVGVGNHYDDFSAVTDDMVVTMLNDLRKT